MNEVCCYCGKKLKKGEFVLTENTMQGKKLVPKYWHWDCHLKDIEKSKKDE